MSCRESSWRESLICCRALYGRWEVPVEVSIRGSSGTLKSPPRMRIPDWKDDSKRVINLKNGTWEV